MYSKHVLSGWPPAIGRPPVNQIARERTGHGAAMAPSFDLLLDFDAVIDLADGTGAVRCARVSCPGILVADEELFRRSFVQY